MTLDNVTVYDNESTMGSGGIFSLWGDYYMARFDIRNTIIAGNTAGGAPSDCGGVIISRGFNLIQTLDGCAIDDNTNNIIGMDPHLAPLADNGGSTSTHQLLDYSPAID